MDSQQPKTRDKDEEKKQQEAYQLKQANREGQQQPPVPPSTVTGGSPPSPSSSPSHDFSFTISLHQPANSVPDKANPPSSIALDLSPADDIFFHGHLLPLHLLSHLPVSPRSSTNSLDSFTLPIRELLEDQTCNNNNIDDDNNNNDDKTSTIKNEKIDDFNSYNYHNDDYEIKGRPKSKSFSWLSSKRRKENDVCREKEDGDRQKRKLKFDVSQLLKRYIRMVRPLLSFKNRRESVQIQRQAYSFSGNLSLRRKQDYGRRRGEFSAPASMRTSPTNSGLLVATGALSNSTSDSTMEELQAAIQAAIAHCKNSIAMEDKKIKCHE